MQSASAIQIPENISLLLFACSSPPVFLFCKKPFCAFAFHNSKYIIAACPGMLVGRLFDLLLYFTAFLSEMCIRDSLGSMLTPIGNPQNLYLYARAGMSAAELITLMLPYSATALILLLIWIQAVSYTHLSLLPEQNGRYVRFYAYRLSFALQNFVICHVQCGLVLRPCP